MHACKTVRNLADTDKKYKKCMDEIEGMIKTRV